VQQIVPFRNGPFESWIDPGKSNHFQKLVNQLKEAAASNRNPVLLVGEKGAGKEKAAHALHYWRSRRAEIFLPASTPATNNDLAADESFAHEPNSLTEGVFLILSNKVRNDILIQLSPSNYPQVI
jgi:DNA-binding NtrC family response regulator